MKRMLTALVLISVMAVSALAATKTVTGKVTAIEGTKVTIVIEGDRADWVKKNGFVKFKIGPGKIVDATAAGVTPATIVVNTKKAADMKVGETVTFEKGLAVSGC